MTQVKDSLNATLIEGDYTRLHRISKGIIVASMQIENFLSYLKDNILVIVSGDRVDIILATIASIYSSKYPKVSGIVLTGGLGMANNTKKLLNGFKNIPIPILGVKEDTFTTAINVQKIKPQISHHTKDKISTIFGLFTKYIDNDFIYSKLQSNTKDIVTPMMFEYSLFARAKKDKKTIVLPESSDERILKASQTLLNLDIVNIILIGDKQEINHTADFLGVNIDKAIIIDPKNSPITKEAIDEFYRLRKHKCILENEAKDTILNSDTYFATMLVQLGYADGMVSGAIHTTADTIRPALQIIKTQKNIKIVSSIFFICFETKVLVYGNCAVNQDPTADELSQIAISSTKSARHFGINPKVAMLSYSTGNSGSGIDVDKVKQATKLIQEKEPTILVEGPIQYDAAIDKKVASLKLPNSKVAGDANVLIFPDLNTGNNTYKAVQRSSNAVAIGPILQGLNKPINDLSRGCSETDIVNTVAITAIQASTKA
jgi:phosphate acetyltransferase